MIFFVRVSVVVTGVGGEVNLQIPSRVSFGPSPVNQWKTVEVPLVNKSSMLLCLKLGLGVEAVWRAIADVGQRSEDSDGKPIQDAKGAPPNLALSLQHSFWQPLNESSLFTPLPLSQIGSALLSLRGTLLQWTCPRA